MQKTIKLSYDQQLRVKTAYANLKPLRRRIHASLHKVVASILLGEITLEDVQVLLYADTTR